MQPGVRFANCRTSLTVAPSTRSWKGSKQGRGWGFFQQHVGCAKDCFLRGVSEERILKHGMLHFTMVGLCCAVLCWAAKERKLMTDSNLSCLSCLHFTPHPCLACLSMLLPTKVTSPCHALLNNPNRCGCTQLVWVAGQNYWIWHQQKLPSPAQPAPALVGLASRPTAPQTAAPYRPMSSQYSVVQCVISPRGSTPSDCRPVVWCGVVWCRVRIPCRLDW